MVHFNFNSVLPESTDFLEAHDLLQVCCICPPDSTIDDSIVFSCELYPVFVCGESSEEAPEAEEGSGSGFCSVSPSPEAQISQRGEGPRRQQSSGGRSRGGRGRTGDSKHRVYKGVRKRQEGRWVSEIREPGKKSRIWLGTFPTAEMAACAYDVAAFNLQRPYAYVNFPEAVSSLPVLQTRSPKHIQEAAAVAAANFREAAASSHAGRSGGLVPTSQVAQTSNVSSTSSPMSEQREQLHPQSTSVQTTAPSFFDEDLIFNMPSVLTDMAEGLMITLPLLHHGTEDGDNNINNNNGDNDGTESSLWGS